MNIKSVSYDVKMPYVAGTISENVLPQLDDLLVLLPPYKIVNVVNIKSAQFVEDVLTLEPKKKDKRKSKRPSKPSQPKQPPSQSQQLKEQSNKPQQLPSQSQQPDKPKQDDTVSIQNIGQPEKGKGTALNIPMQWIVASLGIIGFVIFWMKKRR